MKYDNPISTDKDDVDLKKRDSSKNVHGERSLLSTKIAKSGMRENRTDRNQRKGLITIGLLVLVFFVLLFVLILNLPEAPELPVEENVQPIDTADVTDILSLDAHEATRYYPFRDHLVYLSQDRIAISNYAGEDIYYEQIDLERPIAVFNDRYFLVGDRNSGQIMVFDHITKKFSLRLDAVFAGAYFGGENLLAIIEENLDKPGYVHIVDLQSGEKTVTLQFVESGYPLAVSFSNNLDFFDVLLINTRGSVVQPIIKRYDLEGNQIGQKIPEDYPFLYGKISHDQNNNIVVASTSNILVFNLEQDQPIAEYAPGKIYELIDSNKHSAFVSTHVEGNLQIVDWDSENKVFEQTAVDVGSSFDNYTYADNLIAFNNNNRVKIYDQDKASIILDQVVNADIIRMGLNDNQLVLITDQGVKTLDF